jgi:hypothetical protein
MFLSLTEYFGSESAFITESNRNSPGTGERPVWNYILENNFYSQFKVVLFNFGDEGLLSLVLGYTHAAINLGILNLYLFINSCLPFLQTNKTYHQSFTLQNAVKTHSQWDFY